MIFPMSKKICLFTEITNTVGLLSADLSSQSRKQDGDLETLPIFKVGFSLPWKRTGG